MATEPDVRTPEGLYAVLFKADPAWTPVRRRLTTTQAGALDAEALRFCGEVLAAGGSGALLAYDPRERARAIIERHGREAREHDDRARRAR